MQGVLSTLQLEGIAAWQQCRKGRTGQEGEDQAVEMKK